MKIMHMVCLKLILAIGFYNNLLTLIIISIVFNIFQTFIGNIPHYHQSLVEPPTQYGNPKGTLPFVSCDP